MAKDYRTEDGARIAPLGELRDFEVAEGYPDIRGWRVDAANGVEVGKVHELLVDVDSMRTRYLDVRLTTEVAASPGHRDVLIPIGAARIDEKADLIVLPLSAERVALLPPYDHERLTRAHEYEVRRHFTTPDAAAAVATGAAGAREFYDDATYDDRRFFSSRRTAPTPAGVERGIDRDIRVDDAGMRIHVERDDEVVLKRGEGGKDEIIIRRPRGEEGRTT